MNKNFPTFRNLATLAEQYFSAWEILTATKEELYFPRYYLIGTCVELYLKAIILINHKECNGFFTHDLNELCKIADIKFSSIYNETLSHLSVYVIWYGKYLSATNKEIQEKFLREKVAMSPDKLNSIKEILANQYKMCVEK